MKEIATIVDELVKPLFNKGYVANFYMEKGNLICADTGAVLTTDNLTIDESYYHQSDSVDVNDFVVFAITVVWPSRKGIWLIAAGHYKEGQIPAVIKDKLCNCKNFQRLLR